MTHILRLLQKIEPGLLERITFKHRILNHVHLLAPVGRRTLASYLDVTERILRSEVEALQKQGLIMMEPKGMFLTQEGNHVLRELDMILKDFSDMAALEREAAKKLGVHEVIVVSGDSEKDELVKKEMGRRTVDKLQAYLQEPKIIAVTGGSTVAAVAEMMEPAAASRDHIFVPARGGLGTQLEYQANTLAAAMAKKTGSRYRLLHVPDRLSEASCESLMQEPQIQEILHLMEGADIILHGIGQAVKMAEKRQTDAQTMRLLLEKQAVGEAFGYYFNLQGEVIYKMPAIGIRLEHIKESALVCAVAGGAAKAKAIYAVTRLGIHDVIVIDEAAARALLSLDL